jgi:hypothetical protein
MKTKNGIKDWLRIYRFLTNPDERRKRRRKEEIKQRIEDKKKDVGL